MARKGLDSVIKSKRPVKQFLTSSPAWQLAFWPRDLITRHHHIKLFSCLQSDVSRHRRKYRWGACDLEPVFSTSSTQTFGLMRRSKCKEELYVLSQARTGSETKMDVYSNKCLAPILLVSDSSSLFSRLGFYWDSKRCQTLRILTILKWTLSK